MNRPIPQVRVMTPFNAFVFQYIPEKGAVGMSVFDRSPFENVIHHKGGMVFTNQNEFKLFVDGISDFQRQCIQFNMPEPANDNQPDPSTGEPIAMDMAA